MAEFAIARRAARAAGSRKRIFLVEMSAPHWLRVAEALRLRQVDVIYWTGWFRIAEEVRKRFPEATFHDTFFAKVGLDPQGNRPAAEGFDSACELVWREDAQIVYDMMNRFDHSRDQSFVERSTLFYEHLAFWRRVLREQEPDLVVFSTPPHVVFDYVLLALCRALGVPTLMFEEATIFAPYCLAMSDYRDGSQDLAAAARQRNTVTDEVRAVVARLRASYDVAIPDREMMAQQTMRQAVAAGMEGLLARVREVEAADNAAEGEFSDIEVNMAAAYKERGRSLRESFRGPYYATRYMRQLVEDRRVTDTLREFYDANVIRLEDVSQPFVYVALAGQPERTSNPQAGIFASQILMANILAHALPPGWLLLVKEHPNQFHPSFAVNMCRDLDYYRALLALPNTRLLATSTNPFSIIDSAEAVATSGGTSALEAVARGKPALLFGDAWYRDCPGITRVRSLHDATVALRSVASGAPIVPAAEFENYVAAIAAGCFRGLADFPPDGYPISDEENADNLAGVVQSWLERQR